MFSKKIISLLLLITIINLGVSAQKLCQNFENLPITKDPLNELGFWTMYNSSTNVALSASINIEEGNNGKVISARDASGATFLVNTKDFDGNWVESGKGCFCFDYKILADGAEPGIAESKNSIYIFNNLDRTKIINVTTNSVNSNPLIGFRFELNQPLTKNSPWQRICLPIKKMIPGDTLPGNIQGKWKVYGQAMGGKATVAEAWNELIQNVTDIAFGVDLNSFQDEKIGVDNLCLGCELVDLNCCPKFDTRFTVIGSNNESKIGYFAIDNLNNSSPICKVSMSFEPKTNPFYSNLEVNGKEISPLLWNPNSGINLGPQDNAQYITFNLFSNYVGTMTVTIERCDGTKCEYKQIWEGPITNPDKLEIKEKSIDPRPGYRLSGHQIILVTKSKFVPPGGLVIVNISNTDPTDQTEFFAVSAGKSPFGYEVDEKILPVTNVSMSKKYAVFEVNKSLTEEEVASMYLNLVLWAKAGKTELRVTKIDATTGKILATSKGTINTLANVNSTSLVLNETDTEKVFELFDPFPNPAQNEVNLKYMIGQEKDLRLELYNLDGKLVQTIEKGKKQAGLHDVKLDITSLPAATYLVKLVAQNEVSSTKIVVVK